MFGRTSVPRFLHTLISYPGKQLPHLSSWDHHYRDSSLILTFKPPVESRLREYKLESSDVTSGSAPSSVAYLVSTTYFSYMHPSSHCGRKLLDSHGPEWLHPRFSAQKPLINRPPPFLSLLAPSPSVYAIVPALSIKDCITQQPQYLFQSTDLDTGSCYHSLWREILFWLSFLFFLGKIDSAMSASTMKQDPPPMPGSGEIPAYTPPSSGFLSLLPSSWTPYAELMRVEKPAGLYAFYIPYLIGLGYGACLTSSVPSPTHLLGLSGLFLVYCIILRGAACAWNDNVDQEFDRQVARTKLRPIARGAVSTTQGHIFTIALLLAQIPVFLVLPTACVYHAIPINLLFGIYALMKRVTHYPQFVLGFPFAWAILMSCAALDVDPISNDHILPTMSLLAANILWTMIYDTVYAHQDVQDDIKAGVKSMAVRFADSTKELAATLATIQIALLSNAGWQTGLSPAYFMLTCGGTAVALASMIARVDLNKPSSCAWFFHRGFWYVGGSILMGFVAEYTGRVYNFEMVDTNLLLKLL